MKTCSKKKPVGDWQQQLQLIKNKDLYRQRTVRMAGNSITPLINGKNYVSFSSNDYLGLSFHPKVIKAYQLASERYGIGSGAAHLYGGYTAEHHALEEELAAFLNYPRVLFFATGYMANLGLISALVNKSDRLLMDHASHASLIDGARLSGAAIIRYRHLDLEHLQKKILSIKTNGKRWLVSDAVFSTDGSQADLTALVKIAAQHAALLIIDDAHGVGILGPKGQGSIAAANLNYQQVPILMATLSKALGTFGAVVAADANLIDYLIHKARAYFFSTASPASLAAATRASLQVVITETWRRQHVFALVLLWQRRAKEYGLPIVISQTAIQTLLIHSVPQALILQHILFKQGMIVAVLRPPTVPLTQVGLRITLTALHTEQQIEYLLLILKENLNACLSLQ
jgi:8-amino-7-oxononanoate synthase